MKRKKIISPKGRDYSVRKFISVALFVLIFFNYAYPQENYKNYRMNKDFLANMKNDFLGVVASPAKWNNKDVLRFSALVGSGFIFYILDDDINRWIEDSQAESTENFSRFFSDFGHGLFIGGLALSLYAAGEIADNYSFRKTGLLCLESWLTAGVLVLSLKTLTGRARPYAGKGSMIFNPFASGSENHSLPSGHAASAFAAAAVIADQTDIALLDIFSYSLAGAVALSRVYNGQHWASDIFIGSALGYFVGKKICRMNNDNKKYEMRFTLLPNCQGLTVSVRF